MTCQRWLSTILAILRVLLQIGKEEVILSRLNEIEVYFDTSHMTFGVSGAGTSSSHMTWSSSHMSESADSLISSSYGTVQPQEVFSRSVSPPYQHCLIEK